MVELTHRLQRELMWKAAGETYDDFNRPVRRKWWDRWLAMRAELVSLAENAEAGHFRERLASAGEIKDLALLDLGALLPTLRLLEQPSADDRALDRLDLRTILIGERLLAIFHDTYPGVAVEHRHDKTGTLSKRCAEMPMRWGPGALFIAIAARFIGIEPPDDVADIYRARKQIAHLRGKKS